MKKSTWREQRVRIPAGSVKEVNFLDTIPNHIYFANNSAYNIYVSISPLVNQTLFDMIIAPYATKLFARDEGTRQIYIYNSGITDADVAVNSFYADFDPRSLPQTSEITGSSAASILGVVDIGELTKPLPVGGNVIGGVFIASELPAGDNIIGKVGIDGSIPAGVNEIGKVGITGSLPGGVNKIGTVGIIDPLPAGSEFIGSVGIGLTASNNGGQLHRLISAATINATNVKAEPGRISWLRASNTGAAAVYLKIYDKAAAPDPAADTPIMTLVIPAEQTIDVNVPAGIYCSTGISYLITAAVGDTDTTAIPANDVIVNMQYI